MDDKIFSMFKVVVVFFCLGIFIRVSSVCWCFMFGVVFVFNIFIYFIILLLWEYVIYVLIIFEVLLNLKLRVNKCMLFKFNG